MSERGPGGASGADLIKIGQITAPHGVAGEVRVFPLTDFPERFTTLRRVLLGAEARPIGLCIKGTIKGLIILAIEGITDRDQAEKLRGQYLQVPKAEAFPLPEGYHYVFDLIGLDVVDPDGSPLGKLVDVDQSSSANDLYVVETPEGKRYMIPAVAAFVRAIDLKAGVVTVAPIPGLLED